MDAAGVDRAVIHRVEARTGTAKRAAADRRAPSIRT